MRPDAERLFRPPPPDPPPVLNGHAAFLPPVLNGHAATLPPYRGAQAVRTRARGLGCLAGRKSCLAATRRGRSRKGSCGCRPRCGRCALTAAVCKVVEGCALTAPAARRPARGPRVSSKQARRPRRSARCASQGRIVQSHSLAAERRARARCVRKPRLRRGSACPTSLRRGGSRQRRGPAQPLNHFTNGGARCATRRSAAAPQRPMQPRRLGGCRTDAQPAAHGSAVSCATRRVRLVRKEGRDVSS
jgi:hypothetical protein